MNLVKTFSNPTPLLSEGGLLAMREFCKKRPLIALDFDGTLAPIQLDPETVKLSNENWALLERLESLYGVAVISGRSKADVKGRVPGCIPHIIGNHGIEMEGSTENSVKLVTSAESVATWILELAKLLPTSGHHIEVENKLYSLSLHFSKAKKPDEAETFLFQTLKGLQPRPRLMAGKNVVNVIPEGMPHKGDALKSLMTAVGNSHAIFIGDDVTDEDVFEKADESIFTIAIGTTRPTAARYFIPSQLHMTEVLTQLCNFHVIEH